MQIKEIDIDDFTAWLKTMPADEKYDFNDIDNCALAQYGKAMLGPAADVYAGGSYFRVDDGLEMTRYNLPIEYSNIVISAYPWTFGAVLSTIQEYDARSN